MITISPSCKLPSTTSVDAPSDRPTLIRRDCGLPSWPSTQTRRVWPSNTGELAGANRRSPPLPCCPSPVPQDLHPQPVAGCQFAAAGDLGQMPSPDPRRSRVAASAGSLPEASGGMKRSAEFGTLSTLLRSSIVMVRLAVIPGFSFCSGLLTSITTL